MKHSKREQQKAYTAKGQTFHIEGPLPAHTLATYSMHADLQAFRPPEDQHEALLEIADLAEGRIIIARLDHVIVGYVTFHYPDELERWSEADIAELIELGAIEVAPAYRSFGLGKQMLKLAAADKQLEDYIVFTTEYYWHWDLQGSQLSVWDYRKMMEKLMKNMDMIWYATDDPEICAHPANCLMVRVGSHVRQEAIEAFDRIRFKQRFMY
ncbi:GNAT family N-acetyltransferase [Marinicrinis sediminis]|uniref:GNAT family N-acetyltransferase n=1 Tax=Marinicrinis sediminis TaxID=1652465 RepID=A0ABW5R682_9BACL